MSTTPPEPATQRAQSLYGCVTGSALIGVFLGAGLVSMVLPLPGHLEGLRDPIAVGLGIGGVVATALLAMAPLLLFRSGERRRMERLFGGLEMTGRPDLGHGSEFQGTHGGRTRTASVSLDGASPVTRHTRASFGLGADTGTRMIWCRRGSPYLQAWSPPGCKHVLLLDRVEVDMRSTHPALGRALADDPTFWDDLQSLLQAPGEAERIVTVGPDHLMLRVDGDGATLFDVDDVQRIYETLERLAHAIEARGPLDHPVSMGTSWLDQAHSGRRRMRLQQWAMSCGCLSLIVLAWAAWVAAIVWDAA